MRIHLNTIGCRLNEAELESWTRGFLAHGHSLTSDPEQADLVVLNTCAVTGEAVRKSRKLMHRVHRNNPRAKLVVSGCYASLEPGQTNDIPGVDLVIDNRDKDQLVEIASRELELDTMPQLATEPGANPLLTRGRQRAFIKVQDGCRYQCTFCIVTTARGEERSRPVGEIVEEINRYHQEGVQEAVLTGVHIGGYGSDRDSDLYRLVEQVLRDTDIPRLRLGAVEPWDLPDRFWNLFENPRFMPHLHLPLQSGSDSVLKRMARRCKSDEFERLVTEARQNVPDFNVTTDVIVGFPGETDDEWQQSLAFIERIGFGHLHIFPFSPRAGTLAAMMPNPVAAETVRARSRELHALGEQMKKETLEQYVGRTFPVLIEGGRNDGENGKQWHGYSPNYLRITLESDGGEELENRIVPIRTVSLSPTNNGLVGVIDS